MLCNIDVHKVGAMVAHPLVSSTCCTASLVSIIVCCRGFTRTITPRYGVCSNYLGSSPLAVTR
jgi:hypothetical protein